MSGSGRVSPSGSISMIRVPRPRASATYPVRRSQAASPTTAVYLGLSRMTGWIARVSSRSRDRNASSLDPGTSA